MKRTISQDATIAEQDRTKMRLVAVADRQRGAFMPVGAAYSTAVLCVKERTLVQLTWFLPEVVNLSVATGKLEHPAGHCAIACFRPSEWILHTRSDVFAWHNKTDKPENIMAMLVNSMTSYLLAWDLAELEPNVNRQVLSGA